MAVPYTFGSATSAIPLSQLDSNFATTITLGNTAIQLGNTVTTLNNMTLANVTISSGNVTITNVSVTTANVTTLNAATVIATTGNITTVNATTVVATTANATTANITTGNLTDLNVTNNPTFSGGTANGVLYLNGSKVATSGSALTFDGSTFYANANISASGAGTGTRYFALLNETSTYAGALTMQAGGGSAGFGGGITLYGHSHATYPGAVWIGKSSGTSTGILFGNGGNGVGDEYMRLTSTGLGIGTTSPGAKLDVVNGFIRVNEDGAGTKVITIRSNYAGVDPAINVTTNNSLLLMTNNTIQATLSASGNLGLGVTPSAWGSGYKAYQNLKSSWFSTSSRDANFGTNVYVDAVGYKYIDTAAASLYTQYQGAHSWYNAPSGTAGNAITFKQAMTLDASGHLLVGLTSGTGANIDVYEGGSTDATIRIGNAQNVSVTAVGKQGSTTYGATTAGDAFLYADNSLSIMSDNATGVIKFSAGGNTERARIDSSGNLLVGKTALSQTTVGFEVEPSGIVSDALSASANTSTTLNIYSTGASAYRFYVGLAGTVYATSTTISAISDQRLKENIRDIDVGLDAVMALKPRKFDWKTGKGKDIKNDRGFIAQEFEQVFPDLIDEWKDPAPEGEDPYKSVRQDLIPVLVKAIQELNAKVQALEAQLKGA